RAHRRKLLVDVAAYDGDVRSAALSCPLLLHQAIKPRPVFIGHARRFDACEMPVKCCDRSIRVRYVVAESREQRASIGTGRRGIEGGLAPTPHTFLKQYASST